jgi:hypothetical protein
MNEVHYKLTLYKFLNFFLNFLDKEIENNK